MRDNVRRFIIFMSVVEIAKARLRRNPASIKKTWGPDKHTLHPKHFKAF